MEIGGYDIFISTKLDLEKIFKETIDVFHETWPNLVIEFDKSLQYFKEFFVYPNKEEFKIEILDEDNFSNRMVYCMIDGILDSNYLSLVIDNEEDKEINSIVEKIKERLGEIK